MVDILQLFGQRKSFSVRKEMRFVRIGVRDKTGNSEDKYVKRGLLGKYPMLIKVRYVDIWVIQ